MPARRVSGLFCMLIPLMSVTSRPVPTASTATDRGVHTRVASTFPAPLSNSSNCCIEPDT